MYTRILAMILAGLGWTQVVWSQDANPNQSENAIQKTDDAFHRVTERERDSTTRPSDETVANSEDIRGTLRDVTQAAVTKGGFDGLIQQFSTADRARLSRNQQIITNHPILDGRIAQFLKDWQIRYNQEFKIIDKDAVYGAAYASIKEGYAPEGARLAGEKIVPNQNSLTEPHDEIRDRDQKVATVTIAASSKAPAIDVQMVLEPTGWKIDVPDTFSIQEMHDALLSQITYLDEHREQWPADVIEAYRVVTQRVLMAVLNVDPPKNANGDKSAPGEPGQSSAEDRVLNPNAVR